MMEKSLQVKLRVLFHARGMLECFVTNWQRGLA
jgi:hypothetical protein